MEALSISENHKTNSESNRGGDAPSWRCPLESTKKQKRKPFRKIVSDESTSYFCALGVFPQREYPSLDLVIRFANFKIIRDCAFSFYYFDPWVDPKITKVPANPG